MEQQMDVGKRSSALGNGMGDAEVRIRGVKTNGDGTGNKSQNLGDIDY